MALSKSQVSQLYVSIFNRASEGAGNTYWQDKGTAAAVADAMLATTDAQTYFGTSLATNQLFVEHIYQNTLGKTVAQDPDGIAFWVKALNDGASRGTVVAELVAAVAQYSTSTDPVTKAAYDQFNNRVAVSDYMADTVSAAPADYATSTKFATSGTTGLVVTSDAATVTTAKASVDTIKPQSFTLTTGTDTFTGGSGDDTFTAALLTLGDADVLNGGAGTDTLNAEINANVGATANWDNIEKMNITAFGAKSFNMTAMSGITEFNSVNSTGAITIDAAQSAAMAIGFVGSSTNNITLNHAAGKLSGASDVLTVNLSTAAAVNIDVDAGFESAAFNVTGTSDVDVFTKPGIATVTVAGSGNIDFANATLDGISTLSAGTYTGAMTTGTVNATTGFVGDDIVGATTGTSVILGSGNDNIGFTDATSATTYSNTVKLGAGNDKLLAVTASTGATYIFAEAGDDAVSIGAHDAADLIDMGSGTDTLTITGNSTGSVLRGVENMTISSTATSVVVNSADQAATVTYKVGAGTAASVTGLYAGSTVTLAETAATNTATTFAVGFKAAEAASTITVNAAITDDIDITNITAVTINSTKAVGNGALDDIDVNDATSLTITSTKAIDLAAGVVAGGDKLTALTVTGSEKVVIGDIANDNKLSTVSVTAASTTDSSIGNIVDATSLTSVTATSSAAGMSIGNIGTAAGVKTTNAINVSVSGATTATIGTINSIAASKVGDVTVTATNGLLTAGQIDATDLGTVAYTSTANSIASGAINIADATGATVSMTAKTNISDNGAAVDGEDIVVTNTLGAITASLAGTAAAGVKYAVTAGKGVVNLTATNTGGMNATIVNGGTTTTGETSTVTLGNAISTVNNTLDISGIVDTMNITGGTGKDNIVFDTTAQNNVIKAGTFALGGGTDSVSFAGFDATGANSATHTGIVVNLSSATVTFDAGTSYVSTVSAGQVAQYDNDAAANVKNVDASGSVFTLTDVETVTGTANADYLVANAAGTTFNAGAGADIVIGGAGNDTIDLGAADAASDIVMVGSSAASNGSDTITSFVTTSDKLNVDALTTTSALSASVAVAQAAVADTIVAGEVYLVTSVVATQADSAAGAATAINASGVWTEAAAGVKAYFIVADDDSSAIYEYSYSDSTAEVQAAELTLMGTVDAVLVAGDITFA